MPGNKQIFRTYLDAFVHPDADRQARAVEAFFSKDATISVVHPFNAISGGEAYLETFLSSLRASFDGLYCRDYLLMSGVFEGGDWVSSTGYYAGHFRQDWLGIRPTNALAYLRVGEFHRLENGRAVESYVFLDIPELTIAASQWPITDSPGRDRGYTGFLPGPASQDGLMVAEQDAAQSQRSYQLVTDMLSGLATQDEHGGPIGMITWSGTARPRSAASLALRTSPDFR